MKPPLSLRWQLWRHRVQYYALSRDDEGGLIGKLVRGVGRTLYVVPRWMQGARGTTIAATVEATAGAIHEPHLDMIWGGACPVQGNGTLYGRPAYYRSRGEWWELSVAGDAGDVFGEDAWCYSERSYFWPDGGWVDATVTERCIRRAVESFEVTHRALVLAWQASRGVSQ